MTGRVLAISADKDTAGNLSHSNNLEGHSSDSVLCPNHDTGQAQQLTMTTDACGLVHPLLVDVVCSNDQVHLT